MATTTEGIWRTTSGRRSSSTVFRFASWCGSGAATPTRPADLHVSYNPRLVSHSTSARHRPPFVRCARVQLTRSPGRPVIPKQYKIADACRLLDIQPYVLRYWQTEFPSLASRKTGGGRRDFNAEDLETIRRIKELLYDEGYTIASAKKKLAAELEDGRLRGRPMIPATGDRANGDQEPTHAVGEEAPVDEAPPVDTSDIGALARRVERLEGGVAALVAQARQLAAELKPETGAESD
ncbi:MAG: MerR family transcriptional regulator [Holophagales bacterium]|nr:MerR family transcriptional regulator [Holophagales bacterium]MYC10261.1 MerR family transcriptional regulator [Holophagales bacterium]